MDTRKLLLFTLLAMLTLASWLAGSALQSSGSKLLSEVAILAYPASIIFGAGALLGGATRSSLLRTSRGMVSLARSGMIVLGALAIAALSYNHGGISFTISVGIFR